MEGLFVLAALFFIGAPIVIACMLSGVSGRLSAIESAIGGVRKSLDRLEKSEKRQIAEPEANAPAVTEIQSAMVLPAAETPPPFGHEQDSGLRETAAITAATTAVLRQAVRLRETAAITE